MSCKKCKCKVCSCIKNDVPKVAVNGIVQNPNENDVVNIKVPTKTSQLINDSGFGQGNGGGTGGQKIEDIRVNGELAPILNKEVLLSVPTKTSDLINDSNFVTKPYVDTHIVNKANPHSVTKEQVNLGNVDNTSDLNKPISTATQLALDSKISGVKVNGEYVVIEDSIAEISVPTKTSDLGNNSDFVSKPYVDSHIDSKNNPHNVTKIQVGLGNVDNTSDLNKPISTVTQNELNKKISTTDIKSEVVYEDLKPVNSKAVEKYAVKKINTIADLRNTVGKEEGQVVELLGISQAGDFNPIKYTWAENQQIDNNGTIINVDSGSWVAVESSIPFLIKRTMSDMINTSISDLLALKKGLYKGITLLGYTTQGDTPKPINYYYDSVSAEKHDTGYCIKPTNLDIGLFVAKEMIDANIWDIRYYTPLLDGRTTMRTISQVFPNITKSDIDIIDNRGTTNTSAFWWWLNRVLYIAPKGAKILLCGFYRIDESILWKRSFTEFEGVKHKGQATYGFDSGGIIMQLSPNKDTITIVEGDGRTHRLQKYVESVFFKNITLLGGKDHKVLTGDALHFNLQNGGTAIGMQFDNCYFSNARNGFKHTIGHINSFFFNHCNFQGNIENGFFSEGNPQNNSQFNAFMFIGGGASSNGSVQREDGVFVRDLNADKNVLGKNGVRIQVCTSVNMINFDCTDNTSHGIWLEGAGHLGVNIMGYAEANKISDYRIDGEAHHNPDVLINTYSANNSIDFTDYKTERQSRLKTLYNYVSQNFKKYTTNDLINSFNPTTYPSKSVTSRNEVFVNNIKEVEISNASATNRDYFIPNVPMKNSATILQKIKKGDRIKMSIEVMSLLNNSEIGLTPTLQQIDGGSIKYIRNTAINVWESFTFDWEVRTDELELSFAVVFRPNSHVKYRKPTIELCTADAIVKSNPTYLASIDSYGDVKRSSAVANVASNAPVNIPTQTVTTIEEAQATINILVNTINDLKVLSEENKTQLNAKLTADRNSGQQAIQ